MAKRLTDTSKWKRPWFQSLSRDAKLVWLFLCDDCDHAGIWIADFELMSLRLGIHLNEAKLAQMIGSKLVKLSADRYFIPSFFEFQYQYAKDGFKAKQSALKALRYWNLLDDQDCLVDLTDSYLSVNQQSVDCLSISISKSISNTGGVGEKNVLPQEAYESVYQKYPKKVGKSDGLAKLKKICPSQETLAQFELAMLAYVADCKKNDVFLKQFDTFVNSSWKDWLDPSTSSASGLKASGDIDWSRFEEGGVVK